MKLFTLVLAVVLCVGVISVISAEAAPLLVGTWTGNWGGTMENPMRLVVENHKGEKATGTIVLTRDGKDTQFVFTAVTSLRDGKLALRIEKLVLLITVPTAIGTKTIEKETAIAFNLVLTDEIMLEGKGKSDRHEGPVRLTRQ